MKKFITTTLPYINSTPHIGHCFEFVIADLIADYYRYKLGKENVFLNVGIDEHGQKVAQKSDELNFHSPQFYCDGLAIVWESFCSNFQISYNNFYRTTSETHKQNVLKFYNEIKDKNTYTKQYTGNYCVGCESFKTEKEVLDNKCIIHNQELKEISEENIFFNLKKYAPLIQDILIDKSMSKELENLLKDEFDLSITRTNVSWGIRLNEKEVFYVWFEALLNYIFSIGYYENREGFDSYWENSLQICGKDNLKFQAYIFQAMLLSNNIPQTKELLIHGNILDEHGNKMSKSIGNVIDPIEQLDKYGLSPLKYYLSLGLNTFNDSKYSENELIDVWNNDIVNGLGNVISRILHLVDIKNIQLDAKKLDRKISDNNFDHWKNIVSLFESYDFNKLRNYLNSYIKGLNQKIDIEKPFGKESTNYEQILNELYFELKIIIPFYQIILKEYSEKLEQAFIDNKKVILFKRIEK